MFSSVWLYIPKHEKTAMENTMKELFMMTIVLLNMLPGSRALSTEDDAKSVEKAFGEYQAALKSKEYKDIWNSYSQSFRNDNNYDNFIKEYNKEKCDVYSGLKIEETIASDSTVILKAKVGGIWRSFAKKKMYFVFVAEEGTWKINDLYLSNFSRIPRRGFRPEDFSGLDEKTKSEIEAVQQLCYTYSKSISDRDFRTAWECYRKNSVPYKKFLLGDIFARLKKRSPRENSGHRLQYWILKLKTISQRWTLVVIRNLIIMLFSC